MKIAVHFSSGRVLDVLVLSFVIFATTPSKAYHENRQNNETVLKVNQGKKANELWTRLLVDNVKIPSHHKNVSGVHFATKPSVRKVDMASLHRSGRQKLTGRLRKCHLYGMFDQNVQIKKRFSCLT